MRPHKIIILQPQYIETMSVNTTLMTIGNNYLDSRTTRTASHTEHKNKHIVNKNNPSIRKPDFFRIWACLAAINSKFILVSCGNNTRHPS